MRRGSTRRDFPRQPTAPVASTLLHFIQVDNKQSRTPLLFDDNLKGHNPAKTFPHQPSSPVVEQPKVGARSDQTSLVILVLQLLKQIEVIFATPSSLRYAPLQVDAMKRHRCI